MSKEQAERKAEVSPPQDSATPYQTPGDPMTADGVMSREYAKLQALLPHPTRTKTDLSLADIVEEAASYIEELQDRVCVSYPSPDDAAKAKLFLLQRVTKEFKAPAGDL